ncbi:hypothetical protein B0H14DRAFT_3486337 [Mycena olivaceomarginata]|nr:hypothetical protein B0H14DRAFT_3486337 [Mycena olivaceomarginata]
MSRLHKHIAIDDHINDLFLALACPGLVLTALVLLAFAYTGWNRTSRSHLNRVSFRLLVYAMISSIISHANLIANLFPAVTQSNVGCTFVSFAGLAALMFSACMFFLHGA